MLKVENKCAVGCPTHLGVAFPPLSALQRPLPPLQERLPLSQYRRPLLGTGLCGALTTFSAMHLELVRMIDADRWALATAYAAASILAGFAAVLAPVSAWALSAALARARRTGSLGHY